MNPSVWIDILITMFKNLPKNKVKRMLPNALLSGIERTFLKKMRKKRDTNACKGIFTLLPNVFSTVS